MPGCAACGVGCLLWGSSGTPTLEPECNKWVHTDFEKLLMGAEFYLELLRDKGFIKILSFKNSGLITISSNSSTVSNFISGLGKKPIQRHYLGRQKKWEAILLVSTYPL